MDNCEPGSLDGLPAELLLMVIEQCNMRDLAALSGAARKYNTICRTIIFRHVDLSIHNRGKVKCTFLRDGHLLPCSWYEPSDSLQCNNIPPNMQKRQEAFLSALILNPSLGKHVETFEWTLLLLDSNQRTHLRVDPFAIDRSVVLHHTNPFNKIWNAFAALTNVRTLDLAWLSRHLAMPLIRRIPSILFPAATSVRLVGVMPYALAASILLANPQALLHLDLDNLQQSGVTPHRQTIDNSAMADRRKEIDAKNVRIRQVFNLVCKHYLDDTAALQRLIRQLTMEWVRQRRTRRPFKKPTRPVRPPAPAHRQTRQPWNNLAAFRTSNAYFHAPGPMQNLLGALRGKCTSLQSLHLRKVGARDQFDLTPACADKQTDIYAEWALFLASVAPTLEALRFKQGERLLPRADWVQPPVRPMDQLFGEWIFPVLMGAWPRMKSVVIKGVQQWRKEEEGGGEMVLVDGRAELRDAFGAGVEVVMKRRAREADHLGMGYE